MTRTRSHPRPLTLFDVMTLVAATAVGLAAARAVDARLVLYLSRNHPPLMPLATLTMRLIEWLPLPACWALALLALEFRQPRPPLRKLVRRPGFAAGGATLVAVVTGLSFLAPVLRGIGILRSGHHVGESFLEHLAGQIGVGVATVWLSLALAGNWGTGPTWLERAGVALGAYWVGLAVALGFVVVTDML